MMANSITYPVLGNSNYSVPQLDLNAWIKAQYHLPCSQNSWRLFLDKIREPGKWAKTESDEVCFYALHLAMNTSGDSRKNDLETVVKEVQKKTGNWDFLEDGNWEWVGNDFGISLVSLGFNTVVMPASSSSQALPTLARAAQPGSEFLDHAEILLSENTHTKNGYQILKGAQPAKAAEIKKVLARFIENSLEDPSNNLTEPLREQLLQICQAGTTDSIFREIRRFADELGEIRKIRLITAFYKDFKLSLLNAAQLNEIYLDFKKKSNTLKSVEDKFNALLNFAGLHPEIAKHHKVEVSPLDNNKTFLISISDRNFLLAYSVYTFLVFNNLAKNDRAWSGSLTIFLDLAKLEDLEKALINQLEQFNKYAKIFSTLLGNVEIDNHVQVGQKSRSEVMESASHFFSRSPYPEQSFGYQVLRNGSPTDICVFFHVISLNLNVDRKNYNSDPDFQLALNKMLYLKSKIEEIYVLENMKVKINNNGKDVEVVKTFLKDDAMRTNLVAKQMEQFYPRLDKLIQFQRYMIEKTGKASLYEALGLDTCPQAEWNNKEREAYRDWAVKRVADFLRSMAINPDIAALKNEFSNVDLSLDSLDAKVQTLCEQAIPPL